MATYTLEVNIAGTAVVAVEAPSLKRATEEARASVGVGAVRLGELPCGTPIIGAVTMAPEAPRLESVDGEDVSECQDCGERWGAAELRPVRHLTERVLPGEPMPSGECPECGAVCHPVEPTASSAQAGEVAGGVIRVHYFDYCSNNAGRWSRCYAETEEAAGRRRAEWMRTLGVTESALADADLLCGEKGDVTPIYSRDIELTAAGVLSALNDSDPND